MDKRKFMAVFIGWALVFMMGFSCGKRYRSKQIIYVPQVTPKIMEIARGETTYEKPEKIAHEKHDTEARYIAKTIWGEARGCSPEEQEKVAWCILNRVDDGRFGQGIVGVVTMSQQFLGYSESHPVTDAHYKIAVETIDKWQREKQGEDVVRVLAKDKLYFCSDGRGNNIFR